MAKEKDDSYEKLRERLKTNNIGGAYVFYGEERFLLKHAVGEFRRLTGAQDFDLHILRGKTTLAGIAEAVEVYPFGSRMTLTLVYDFDLYALDAGRVPELEALLSDIPDYAALIFIYDTLEHSPDYRKKAAQAVKKHAMTVNFQKQEASRVVSGVRRRFRELDREISAADAEYLIFISGGLMDNIIGEIEKLAAYSKGVVTRADIDAVAVPVTEAAVFALSDAVAARRADRALTVLDTLLSSKEEPIVLVSILGRQMRQLYGARLALRDGKNAAWLAARWGMKNDYPARLLMKNAAEVRLPWCRNAVRLCADADFELKSKNPDKRLCLETLVMRLTLDA